VTDGEAACPESSGLAQIRRREQSDALAALAPAGAVAVVRLGLPDGRVAEHKATLAAAIEHSISPGTTLVAPFEHDGHCDHDVTGAIALEVAHRHGLHCARYPIWAWHHSTLPAFEELPLGRFELSPPARRAKQLALRCYRSQLRERPGGAVVPAHVLPYFERAYEMFVL